MCKTYGCSTEAIPHRRRISQHLSAFHVFMCCNTQKCSSATPQLGSTLQQRQKVPVGPAVESWMDTAPLPGRFYHIYSSHLLRWELKKHNSVLVIQFLIIFHSDIINDWILLGLQRIFIRNNFPLKQNSEKCHPKVSLVGEGQRVWKNPQRLRSSSACCDFPNFLRRALLRAQDTKPPSPAAVF